MQQKTNSPFNDGLLLHKLTGSNSVLTLLHSIVVQWAQLHLSTITQPGIRGNMGFLGMYFKDRFL